MVHYTATAMRNDFGSSSVSDISAEIVRKLIPRLFGKITRKVVIHS
jgi:hypothetical protein